MFTICVFYFPGAFVKIHIMDKYPLDKWWFKTWPDRLKQQVNKLTKAGLLNRDQLAEKLKVSRSTLANWLAGDRKTKHLGDFDRLARAVDLHPIELLFDVRAEDIRLARRFHALPDSLKESLLSFLEETEAFKASDDYETESETDSIKPDRRQSDRRVQKP